MENFRKLQITNDKLQMEQSKKAFVGDVKRHIDDISRKYILVDEGTVDYALMYIPSESVYYEIVNNSDLFDYSSEKRILMVSPSTFYAYMKAILMSFEGQKIEAQAKQILSSLRSIQNDYQKAENNLSILQKHLTNAYNMMGQVFSSFGSLGQKITSTQRLGDGEKGKKELE
jgi:DNA recombination protein RmuC